MTPSLRAELDRIENFLMGPEGRDLANVLSALRGPDADRDNDAAERIKKQTTTLIRTAAFPRLASTYRQPYNGIKQGSVHDHGTWDFTVKSDKAQVGLADHVIAYHFGHHIEEAAKVLDVPISRSREVESPFASSDAGVAAPF